MTHLKTALPILVLVLLLVAPTSAPVASPERIAVVDLRHAIEGTSDFQRAAEEWTVAMTAETADLSAKQEEIRQAQEKLAAEQEGLNESAIQTRVRMVNELQREFDRMNADVQQQLNGLRERLILPITAKVDEAIREFAKANNLALVLDISNPQVGLVLTDGTIDITAAIVDHIENPETSEDIP